MRIIFYKLILILLTSLSILFAFNFFSGNRGFYNESWTNSITSISLLYGHLDFPMFSARSGIPNDLQFYDQKIFTGWDYGVPILQLPFQLLAYLSGSKAAFPDPYIFIFYALLTSLVVFNFIREKFSNNLGNIYILFYSFFIVQISLLWLISYRFIQYEEVASYYILFSLNTLIYYLKIQKDYNFRNSFILCLNLCILLLLRQPAIIIISFISFYILINKKYSSYRFFILLGIFLIVPFYFNYIKTGSIIGTGTSNINPGIMEELFYTKLGRPCIDYSLANILERTNYFFTNIFLWERFPEKFISNGCFITFENAKAFGAPFLSYVLNGFLFVYLLYIIKFKKYKFDFLMPLLGIFTVFIMFAVLSNGFVYRYVVYFLFFYSLLIYILFESIDITKFYTKNLILIFLAFLFSYNFQIARYQNDTVKFKMDSPPLLAHNWDHPYEFPSIRRCGDVKIFDKDGYGWNSNCTVPLYINTYISIPNNSVNSTYRINLEGENIPDIIDMRLNGRMYKGFNWKKDSINAKFLPVKNYNLFIYFPNERNASVSAVYLTN